MATSSGGIDWSPVIKPILSSIQGRNCDKHDIIDLVQALAKSDGEFQKYDSAYENFYTPLAALAAHFIATNTSFLGAEHVNITRDACKVLVRHLLLKLSEQIATTPEGTPSPSVSIKQLLVPLASLCGVEDAVPPRSDITVLTMLLKDAKLPPNTSNVPDTKTGQMSASQSTERRRTDGLAEVLTGPLRINPAGSFITSAALNSATSATNTVSATNTTPVTSTASTATVIAATTLNNGVAKPTDAASVEIQEQTTETQAETSQPTLDAKKFVTDTCVSFLGPMRAGATLLSLCGALPCLQRYLLRLRQAKEAGTCHYQHHSADATLVGFLVKEVGICQTVMSLPCLEPLTASRITLLTDIAAAWLLCATTQASVSLKDEDGFETLTAQLVEGALCLFNTIGDVLKTSTRAGGYVYQNHQMIGTWVLLSGLHQMLSGAQPSTPQPTSKSPARPSRPYNLTRLLQGVQVTWVALGFRCLEGIRSLLADARLEAQASAPMDVDNQTSTVQGAEDEDFKTPASLNALSPHTATQRAARIAACAPLHQLLIFFAVVCFRKATALKRAVVQKQHEQDADHSDSTVYYQDMIMCSEDSETEDDDSEPLLGLWFESTLVAPDGNEPSAGTGNDGGEGRASNQPGIVPDKAEPYSYISLATEILLVLDSEILCAGEADTQRLGSSCVLPDAQINLLVALVRDLDRETARTDTGTINPCFGARLGRLYSEFSSALVRYLHSLTSSLHVGHMAHVLLDPYTSIAPSATNTSQEHNGMVPLQVGSRIVKLMASLILAKRVCDREACILSVWSKTVATLTECALQPQPSADHECEDMNVEFAQLLVYLFHSLNLMQKKSVLITTANAIIKVCESLKMRDRTAASQVAPHQLMLVTRLLLLLEYIMKHLYDAPPCLLQQIEWNLIVAPGLAPLDPTTPTSNNVDPPSRMYCTVAHVEEAYRKKVSQDADVSMRPKFYALTNTEINNQETPKLDGLACNFVLGTPDKLKYPQLLSALLSLLNCASLCDHHPPLPEQALCAAHYCFQTAWRLVITMPPSTPHMEEVSGGTDVPLHSLIWAPRAAHQKSFSPWLKDALVKQGMYTQYAENLLSNVTTTCDNIPHTIWMATNTFKQLEDNISPDTRLPSLIDVMTVNCVLLRLRFLLEADATKQQQQASSNTASANTTTTSTVTSTTTTSSGGASNTNTSSTSSSPSPPPAGEAVQTPVTGSQSMQEFIGQLLDILETVLRCCCICVTRDFTPSGDEGNTFAANIGGTLVLEGVLRCCGSRAAPWLRGHLPPSAKAALDKVAAGPPFTDPISTFSNDIIPCESGILHVVSKHCQLMSSGSSSAPLLLLALETISTLSCQVQTLAQSPLKDRAVSLLLPACVDGRLEYLQDHASSILNQVVVSAQKVEQAIDQEVLSNMYPCMVGDLSTCNDKILKGMVKYWEKVLERPAGRQAMEELFGKGKFCLGEVLICAPSARQPYSSRVVRFFNKVFQWCSTSSSVEVCVSVMSKMGSACSTPSPSSSQPGSNPSPWLAGACLASPHNQKDRDASPATRNGHDNQQSENCSWSGGASDSKESVALALFSETSNSNDNALLLENLTRHMILHCDESSSMSLLSALISLAPEALRAEHAGLPLPRLLREAARLADAHTGHGHRELLPAALKWLNTCVDSLQDTGVLDSLEQNTCEGQQKAHLEAACHLLAYISDCLHACFGPPTAPGGAEATGMPPGQLPSWDAPPDVTPEADWADDPQDDDDTSADDSDEDSMLRLKLCTFTTTAREYMNQHWYHCHTCKMVDSVGVCTVCALVCHRNHDVTYAKYGNFFCDCGAKEDSSCRALVKRSSSHSTSLSRRGTEPQEPQPPPSLLRRRPSSPPHRDQTPPHHRRPAYASNINGIEPWVWDSPEWLSCLTGLQRLLGYLSGPVSRSCERHSAVGRHARAREGLAQLHAGDVKFQITDQLMVPTLGSQEGAFENVRMSYTGEQGQAIRHLIVAHVVRRVAMCCMALPNGKRQHLAVSHEKGKITILQLSQLLKQADSSKRKLTLTRLTSASIPFPVLSLSASPYNEDVLAVTGYRDCHILTFTGGPIYQRLVMQPGLDPGNFIIRSIWLPGNQTQLALVTADFVKIYDLSKDATLPEYHFLVPSGKVRDVTFVSLESATFMLCMGSAGHIYWQAMNEVSHASNGPFYITNTVDVMHNDIKDVNGQVGGGGVSIYYSHTLKMLFFSYAQGKSFMAPLTSVEETLQGVTLIQVSHSSNSNTSSGGSGSGGSGGSGKGGSSKGGQALCQWQEVPGHPGLVTAVLQASNNPIVMMLTPNSLLLQEIKVIPVKAKITDMVAVRHSAAGDSKTTLILLCEDGSLRIYAASPEMTGYWLSPSVSPTPSPLSTPATLIAAPVSGKPSSGVGIINKRFRNTSLSKSKNSQTSNKPGGNPTFPVDFFEHCVALNDVEFGGNDLLQVYNTAQIKHRLATNGLYVVSTKLTGFTIEITNIGPSSVITGLRVLLGNQDVSRTPTYIEVCGRTIPTNVTRNRWYDVPLTREESLQADRKLTVIFGPSQDPEGVCMVDSIKVYGRNKEAFGWPEENDEGGTSANGSKHPQESSNQPSVWTPPGVERLACGLLETLELSLGAPIGQKWWGDGPKDTATNLLCAPCPPPLQARCKALLHALLGQQYHQHKDQAILSHVMEQLHEMYVMKDPRSADPENFFRLVLLARAVAAVRPQNLVKYAGTLPQPPASPSEWSKSWTSTSPPTHLAPLLVGVLTRLSSIPSPPCPPCLAPVDRSGLRHHDHALHALADVIHTLMVHAGDQTMIDMGNRIYLSLLLSEDQMISFGAKSAIVRVLRPRVKKRRVYIPSPPATPGASSSSQIARSESPLGAASSTGSTAQSVSTGGATLGDQNHNQARQYMDVDQVVDMSRLLGADPEGLEALLDIPPDADDDVEFAIVLSLQEGRGGAQGGAGAPSLPRGGSGAPSDATASATGSDEEEGDNEVEGEGEGEGEGTAGSGGAEVSPVGRSSESGSATSGRSSAYGETTARTNIEGGEASQWSVEVAGGADTAAKVRSLRLALLDLMVEELPHLRGLPGIRTIPFMQVLLMLASAMECGVESEQVALERCLCFLVSELSGSGVTTPTITPESTVASTEAPPPVHCRTPRRELQLLIMRLLSVLMARWKPTSGSTPAPSTSRPPSEWHTARTAASALRSAGVISRCEEILRELLPHWKEQQNNAAATVTPVGSGITVGRGAIVASSSGGASSEGAQNDAVAGQSGQMQLLRPQPPHPLPDMQPFFLRQYVKSHAWDVLENYPNLLTEMSLRLPYQVQQHCDPPAPPFSTSWHSLLCQYMMNQQTPFLKKQVRKLLLMMCGTKDKYRQLRDVHALNVNLEGVHKIVEGMDFSYDSMVTLMDHLKACVEIVVTRTGNWQHMCSVHSPNTLSYLVGAACLLGRGEGEGVAPTILQLLQGALCNNTAITTTAAAVPAVTAAANNDRTERGRSAESDASVTVSSKFQEQIVPQLVQQILNQVTMEQLRHFIRVFLLETNSTSVRWQAHALLLAIYENCTSSDQARLVKLMWELWPALPQFGRKTAQFVDLLGYFSLKTPHVPMEECLKSAVNLLKAQNQVLTLHGNAPIYSALSNYVELEGYYLESEPCLVCNNPETPMSTIKLSTIRIDSKFTTQTQIVKLAGSHTISRIGLRIGDLKRTKMVRTINVFYNNRTVQAVQELKNKPGMWHKAKQVVLISGQTDVRIDFPLPIVACNLMMEYADFYENTQASGESLQCPRCSAAVPANPGVCSNCGENVFQCHKCRAINYDEKDPFLCHACGFCKYAKFDYTLTARPCCAVERIENDEDRKRMVASIGLLLDKADRVYRQLVANKPVIENLLHKISEHRVDVGRGPGEEGTGAGSATSSGAQVNRVIQYVAHKYCVDSKNHFDDLSKIIQRVLTCRRELVAYDKSQSDQLKSEAKPGYTALLQQETAKALETTEAGHCYGCALAAASHCLTLLRALASSPEHRQRLCQLGLVTELVHHNLRRGTPQSQEEVRQLICVVTRDNLPATVELCNLLLQRITLGLLGHAAAQDHTNAVRPLVLLLGGLVKIQDCSDCWEVRLRCVIRLWVWCCPYLSTSLGVTGGEAGMTPPPPSPGHSPQDAHALQQVALPCLQYLHHLMQAPTNKDGTKENLDQQPEAPPLDLGAWLAGLVSYADWKRRRATPTPTRETELDALSARDEKLALKYTNRWKAKAFRTGGPLVLSLGDGGWLKPVMFNPSSKMARDVACQMIKSLCTSYERTKVVLLLLTQFLPEICCAGEASEQFLQLYQSLASEAPWKQFLALHGVLSMLADLLTKEIDHLHILEETTLTSDLAQGYALKRLTELMAMFLEEGGVRRAYKGRLMGAVLGGYLSLRRLVIQRTRLIDDTQEKLLELLEEMTTGTEAETAEFMAVCIETVKKYPLHDFRTPVFIFERLCSIIYPEENDVGEFFLSLEKDPQQEDFLQGRMLGNPYSSLEAGLGPLMRDVKNKICADCELVALLEDDNGMELLVNNKIMSLDLPVKEVYKKVWCVSGEGDAMRVVYRMRGLLGDATEEFVETLSSSSTEAVDDEQVYKMANVLAYCGGMEVMLERLAVAGGGGGAARPLARTLLRLLSLCVRARSCVRVLTQHTTQALPALLQALNMALHDEMNLPRPELTCNLLEIMDRILSVAAGESMESFLQFSLTFGGPEYVQTLLNCTQCPGIRNNQEALQHLTRVLAALVYGNELKMAHLCQHFKQVLDFNKFDADHRAEDEFRLELFCVLCSGIERNAIGGTLKDYLISLGIVRDALDYITMHAPCVKPTLLRTDSDELKEFISKPALKYILRFLTGLATDHEPTQMAVCEKVIPIVHRLEQVSSDEHVGSLAENLLEALMSEPQAAKRVRDARDYTRQEKKRLAMAMREKQLGALGMRTNDKGQVTAQCSLTHQVQELGEETGAICCICREGYKYQPTKVLGIYTFTKRCAVEEFEVKARKTLGYTTVTHFNVVHVECHMSAVRLARSRDEWESAALQNASTKCNGLLPLWGPHVPESAFASCLARHNTYLQECTGHHDIGYQCTVHDLKLLLLRFAREKTFHEDTGGGGPLSNMQLVPSLLHMALYVINTTRISTRLVASLQAYLEWTWERQLESSHEAEGPLYYLIMALLMQPPNKWSENRVEHLRRILILSQVRSVSPSVQISSLQGDQTEPRPYEEYKPYLMYYSIIQLLYDEMFKHVPTTPADQWPVKLAEAIRHGDEGVLRCSERILSTLSEQLLPCQSLEEWLDAIGLLGEVPSPYTFLKDTLQHTT